VPAPTGSGGTLQVMMHATRSNERMDVHFLARQNGTALITHHIVRMPNHHAGKPSNRSMNAITSVPSPAPHVVT
jgi:hypothetical protein